MHTLRVTAELLALLRARRIFHSLRGQDRLRVGDAIVVPQDCRIEPYSQLLKGQIFPAALGAFSYSNSDMASWVRVGRYSSRAPQIGWMGGGHPLGWATTSPALYRSQNVAALTWRAEHGDYEQAAFPLPDLTVNIGHDVWIASEATIAPGVTIGDGAVIGARALVLDDVPPYAIVVGHPARVQRLRFPEPLVERFLAARWWRFPPGVIAPLPVTDPARFLDAFEDMTAREAPEPLAAAPLTAEDLAAACEPLGDPQVARG